MKRRFLTFIISVALPQMLLAQYTVPEQGLTQVVMNFLATPRDPVALAQGGSDYLGSSSPFSVLSAVAALPFDSRSASAAVSYGVWQPSMAASSTAISAAMSYNAANTFGLGFFFATDPQRVNTVPSDDLGIRNDGPQPSTIMVGGGFAYRPFSWLSLGASARYAEQSLVGSGVGNMAFDLSAVFMAGDFLIAAGGHNLGSRLDGRYMMPGTVWAATDWQHDFGHHQLGATAQADYYIYGASRLSGGLRYTFDRLLSIRGGYNHGGASPLGDFVSFGGGINLRYASVDAVYLSSDGPLDGTFCISLTIKY